MTIFPVTAITDVVNPVLTFISDNIVVVLGIVGFSFGLVLVKNLFNNSLEGNVSASGSGFDMGPMRRRNAQLIKDADEAIAESRRLRNSL